MENLLLTTQLLWNQPVQQIYMYIYKIWGVNLGGFGSITVC